MLSEIVLAACRRLSPLMSGVLTTKILKHKEPPLEFTPGEALLFWTADFLSAVGLLGQEQLWLVLDAFASKIVDFGNVLGTAPGPKYPMCRFALLDRSMACFDGCDTFVDYQSGKAIPAFDAKPLETITYNLTAIWQRYRHIAGRPTRPADNKERNDGVDTGGRDAAAAGEE